MLALIRAAWARLARSCMPGVNDGIVHEPLLDVVAGQEAGTPGRSPVLEHLRVFVEQHKRLGPQAVLGGVQFRYLLPRFGAGPGALLSVPAIGFELGCGDYHG